MLKNRLALLMSGLALMGWGTFVYNAHSSAGAQHELRVQVADLIAAQERLIADDQRTADDLNAAREALSNLKASSERTSTERDDVRAQLAAAREEMTTLEKRLGEVQPRQTGSVRSVTPPARTTPPPPTRMSGDRLKPSL
jgi:septal ring factor EnvC (AmiA/AmiB activator)